MKRTIIALIISLTCEHVFASPIETVNNQASINLGYMPTQINNSPPVENSQYLKGHELNLGMAFTKLFYNRLYTRVAINALTGNLSYGHDTIRTTATSFTQIGDVRAGYLFLFDKVGVTPYANLGYQYWQLEVGGHVEDHLIKNGYTRFYQNGFYGVGLLSQIIVNPRLVASLDLTLGKTINPWLRFNAPDQDNAQIGRNIIYQSAFMNPQLLYQVGVGVDYAVNDTIHANAGVQFNHQEYASTGTNPSKLLIPHESISQWNYHAGVGFNLDSTSLVSDMSSDTILIANNQANVWFGYIFQNYGETEPNTDYYFDREVKNIPAVNMNITKTFYRLYSQFNLLFAGGNTAYKSNYGTTNFSGSPPTNDYTRNTLLVTGLRLGYMLYPNDHVVVTPYVSGGYRRWLRDLTGVEQNGYLIIGYSETYQFAWYSLGLLYQYAYTPNLVFNIDGNAGSMENVTNKSWTYYKNPATYQKLLTLKQRFIYNIGVGGDYRFAKDWHALLQFNYLYFKFGRSANSILPGDDYWYEPNSTTRQFSAMAGLGYDIK